MTGVATLLEPTHSRIKDIIPQTTLEWQKGLLGKREEQLDTEWQALQLAEAQLLRMLDQDLESHEHDLLFSRLGQIRQRMSEIQWEIEYGAEWKIKTCANCDDRFDHSYHTDVGVQE